MYFGVFHAFLALYRWVDCLEQARVYRGEVTSDLESAELDEARVRSVRPANGDMRWFSGCRHDYVCCCRGCTNLAKSLRYRPGLGELGARGMWRHARND